MVVKDTMERVLPPKGVFYLLRQSACVINSLENNKDTFVCGTKKRPVAIFVVNMLIVDRWFC